MRLYEEGCSKRIWFSWNILLDIFFESIFLVDLTWHATLNSRIPIAEHLLYMVSDALQPQGQIKGRKKTATRKCITGHTVGNI